MPSERVAKLLKLASECSAEERAELADELWNTVPEELSPEWKDEIRRRVAEADAAHARGELPGVALTCDEMLERVRADDKE